MYLIMHEPNIYVNNSKFISIVDNVSILQIPPGPRGRRKFVQGFDGL